MSLQPPTDIQVVKKEDKQARLTDFIQNTLNACDDETPLRVAVFARSVESPVIQALAEVASAFSNARLQIVLTALELEDIDTSPATAELAAARADVRLAADPRLLDAHEQMVLGTATTWIGDCLRREPAKRDAYERFCRSNEDVASGAQKAFDRIWAHAQQLTLPDLTTASTGGMKLPVVAIDPASIEGELGGATAATRH